MRRGHLLYLKVRKLSNDRTLRLAECAWVEECSTVVMISKTSGGKAYVAQALCTAACRKPCDVAYTRLTDICMVSDHACVLNDGMNWPMVIVAPIIDALILSFRKEPLSRRAWSREYGLRALSKTKGGRPLVGRSLGFWKTRYFGAASRISKTEDDHARV
jgi:hypothetical protein